MGEIFSVRNLVRKTTLELLVLDSCTNKEEVEEALKCELGDNVGELKVAILKPNKREQILAIVEIEEQGATKLLETSRIKIGWVNSRERRRTQVSRCFKCQTMVTRSKTAKGQIGLFCGTSAEPTGRRLLPAQLRRDASYVQGYKKVQMALKYD